MHIKSPALLIEHVVNIWRRDGDESEEYSRIITGLRLSIRRDCLLLHTTCKITGCGHLVIPVSLSMANVSVLERRLSMLSQIFRYEQLPA